MTEPEHLCAYAQSDLDLSELLDQADGWKASAVTDARWQEWTDEKDAAVLRRDEACEALGCSDFSDARQLVLRAFLDPRAA